MGYSVPKAPFNLEEFLKEKHVPKASFGPSWHRTRRQPVPDSRVEDDTPPDETETQK